MTRDLDAFDYVGLGIAVLAVIPLLVLALPVLALYWLGAGAAALLRSMGVRS